MEDNFGTWLVRIMVTLTAFNSALFIWRNVDYYLEGFALGVFTVVLITLIGSLWWYFVNRVYYRDK